MSKEFDVVKVKSILVELFSDQIDSYGSAFLKDLADSWSENHLNKDEKNNKGLVELNIKTKLVMEDEDEVIVDKLTTQWVKSKKCKGEPLNVLINSKGNMLSMDDDS